MRGTPMISVVIPVKNRDRLVGAAIQSILDQTFVDWELVVVDDHSTDRTTTVVRSFHDPRIHCLELPEGRTGVPAARHFGNVQAKGSLIAIADSDDSCYPNRLAETMRFFDRHPTVDLVYANIDVFDESTGQMTTRWFQPFSAELLRHINYIPNSTVTYKKAAYRSLPGYDPTFLMAADYDLLLQFLEGGKSFGFIALPLVCYRKHRGNLTADRLRLFQFQEKIKKKYGLSFSKQRVRSLAKKAVYQYFQNRVAWD